MGAISFPKLGAESNRVVGGSCSVHPAPLVKDSKETRKDPKETIKDSKETIKDSKETAKDSKETLAA